MSEASSKGRLQRRLVLYSCALLGAIALLYAGFLWKPARGLEDRLEDVLLLSRNGDFRGAHNILAEVEADFQGHVKIDICRAFLFECDGKLEQAQEAYRHAAARIDDRDQKREVLLSVIDIDRRMGHREKAALALAKSNADYGESVRAKQLRITLLDDEGKHDEALSEARRLVEEEPTNPHAARLCRTLERRAEASASVDSSGSATGATQK